MNSIIRRAGLVLLAGTASALGASQGREALVGTTASVFQSPVCRQQGCVYQGVHRTRLEGSNNPIRVYRYGLAAGQQVEVTRYDLPGRPGHNLTYSLRYLPGAARNAAAVGAAFASAAAGYPVTAAQLQPCFQKTAASLTRSQFITSRGFDTPGVSCAPGTGRPSILIQLTN